MLAALHPGPGPFWNLATACDEVRKSQPGWEVMVMRGGNITKEIKGEPENQRHFVLYCSLKLLLKDRYAGNDDVGNLFHRFPAILGLQYLQGLF